MNLASWIILGIIAMAVAGVVWYLHWQNQKAKSAKGCGGGCCGCSMMGMCGKKH